MAENNISNCQAHRRIKIIFNSKISKKKWFIENKSIAENLAREMRSDNLRIYVNFKNS